MNLHDFLNSIYPVSRETFCRLEGLVDRLTKWQRKTNLIASSTIDEIWLRHVADSLQCLALKPEGRQWLDLGSGGGFPGMVIAAVMADHDDSFVTLVESNNKKAAFLRQASRQIGVRAKIITSRIEAAGPVMPKPKIVTARALAELPLLLEYSSFWLEEGATGLFHKGREYRDEVAKCDGLWTFDLLCHESKVAADSVILEITNLMPAKK